MFFTLLLFSFIPSTVAAQNCSAVTCSNSSIIIRFPFQLAGNQSQSCGYPGFYLSCSNSLLRNTVLKLPNSGEFFVRNISYVKQQVNLYDPGNCLPRRLMRLKLSESPFSAAYVLNFMFLSCPKNLSFYSFGVIDCLSNRTNTVLAISDTIWASYMISYYSCAIIATVRVPVSRQMKEGDGFLVDLSDNNLQLFWGTPNCKVCEKTGGTCGFKNYTHQEVGCFNQKTGKDSYPLPPPTNLPAPFLFKPIILKIIW